jgi:hypothetical protein
MKYSRTKRRERKNIRERKKRTCIGEERAINKIGLIISNIFEKLSGLIIPNRGSILGIYLTDGDSHS